MSAHDSEFEQFMAGLVVADKPEPKPADEQTIGDTVKFVPSAPAEVTEVRPERTYKTDDGKKEIDSHGLGATTTIYSRGYCQFRWETSWRKVPLTRAQIEGLARWFHDPEGYAKWLEVAIANGLK